MNLNTAIILWKTVKEIRNIWLISDTHFLHKNILDFRDNETGELIRGKVFDSIEEHDETIIENWNKTIKNGDIVYHLGDVFMGNKDEFLKLWKRLNGYKRLVLGNHDDAKFFIKNELVQKVNAWRMFPEFGILLTHVPVHDSCLYRGPKDKPSVNNKLMNIHGHIHQNPAPSVWHKCVSVEHINYTPIHIEDVKWDPNS